MKGTELVLKALRDKGVRYIFGYTGGAIMPIFDEMEKQKCFEFIMSRHEQGAGFMAQGVSRASASTATPRTGVCMATSGPGAMTSARCTGTGYTSWPCSCGPRRRRGGSAARPRPRR